MYQLAADGSASSKTGDDDDDNDDDNDAMANAANAEDPEHGPATEADEEEKEKTAVTEFSAFRDVVLDDGSLHGVTLSVRVVVVEREDTVRSHCHPIMTRTHHFGMPCVHAIAPCCC